MSDEKKPMKYYSSIQEKALAEALGWQKIGGSGAAPCAPGDIKASEWLGECKTHVRAHSIYFDADVWKKINNEAMGHNKKPVLFVDNGTQKIEHTWALCCAKNINQGHMVVIDFPYTVKKNITFADEAGRIRLGEAYKEFAGDFYRGIAFEYKWNDEDVLIMPFETFKENYKR